MASYLKENASKIYLCVKMKDKMKDKWEFSSLHYNCIPFNTYEEADNFYNSNYDKGRVESSTMMPVCKYVPTTFHPAILNYKLAKLFINANLLSNAACSRRV
jgi:hypothetical protein